MVMRLLRSIALACSLALLLAFYQVHAQPAAQAQSPTPAAAGDPLGRDTPRGAVVGFLSAARAGDGEIARQYLDTELAGAEAEALAHELFVVLDARLPPRLSQVSDSPEGSRTNPLRPDEEVIGTIRRTGGESSSIVLERIRVRGGNPLWLFSGATLDLIPAHYEEVTLGWGNRLLPRLLTRTRFGGTRLFEWITVLLGLPFIYLLTVLLNKIATPLIRVLWRRLGRRPNLFDGDALPTPVRLLLVAVAIRWSLASLPLPLLARQFWSSFAAAFTVAGIVWLLILLNGEVERAILRRYPRTNTAAAAALVRLLRRMADLLVIFAGLLAMLRRFGVDATPALAGLGVGGIAVALAAQKTLENVIAGASLIFDQAVKVGDSLRMGHVEGTVDHIGLRSTRIRTLDRTIVSVPNSQIANVSIETLSVRDKFWFHPVVGLRPETTPGQLRAVVDGIRRLLEAQTSVERKSVRVRFLRLGASSFEIDVFAYLAARDWNHFLEIQEQLLFGLTETVEAAGTQIAFRPQSLLPSNAPDTQVPPSGPQS